jgi:sugar/nucleoside kinase (ribokinase family)
VGTVYDFRNEKKAPEQSWPLVDDYSVVDLLIMDREEARRISGESEEREALNWFVRRGCGAVVITRGPDAVLFRSSSVKFANSDFGSLPVVADIQTHIERFGRDHDTTGCGDNFAGGMLGSIARQLFREEKTLDLVDAVAEGVIAGGHAATYLGGLYQEEEAGQKRSEIASLREHYRAQIGKGAS